jgi:hypothetical protein
MTGREKILFLFLSTYALILMGVNPENLMSGHAISERYQEPGKGALDSFHDNDVDSNGIVRMKN